MGAKKNKKKEEAAKEKLKKAAEKADKQEKAKKKKIEQGVKKGKKVKKEQAAKAEKKAKAEKGAKKKAAEAAKKVAEQALKNERSKKQREQAKKSELAKKAQEKAAKESDAKNKARAAAVAAERKKKEIYSKRCRTREWTTNYWYAWTDCCRGCDGRAPAPGGMRGACIWKRKYNWGKDKSQCGCRATPSGQMDFKTNRYYAGVDCCAGCRAAQSTCIRRDKGFAWTSV